MNTTEEL